ncbi:MAG: glycoside hydrolase family 16 protein [Clostridia bacterium]|nr:glycoside hydrolase family 16 protein [Clostridia bacterium]
MREDPLLPLDRVEFDYENAFFDDFTGGVDFDSWYICNAAWGVDNGGVIKENVSYTDDGVLALTGNGNYYSGPLKGVGSRTDGTKTGAALISKFLVGPGRYEIKMKPHPRLGTCSALWTFAYDESNTDNNHEIDIEMSGDFTYRHIYNTSWLSDSGTGVREYYITEVDPVNDGNWHVFGFDWYEDHIDYYIDGEFVQKGTAIIPYLQSRLWIGVWFPQGWGGEANFETDQMLVDWVKYIPFKDQKITAYEPTPNTYVGRADYPSHPTALPKINKLANASFTVPIKATVEETAVNAWRGGLLATATSDNITELVTWGEGYGKDGGCGAQLKEGGYLAQYVDAVYENYEYKLSFYAKATGSGSRARLMFYPAQDNVLETHDVTIAGEEWQYYELIVTAPVNTDRIRIRLDSAAGSILNISDMKLTFLREIQA